MARTPCGVSIWWLAWPRKAMTARLPDGSAASGTPSSEASCTPDPNLSTRFFEQRARAGPASRAKAAASKARTGKRWDTRSLPSSADDGAADDASAGRLLASIVPRALRMSVLVAALLQAREVEDADLAAAHFQEVLRLQAVAFPGHRFGMRADAGGDVVVRGRRLDDDGLALALAGGGQAQELAAQTLADRERAHLEHPFGHAADLGDQQLDQLGRHDAVAAQQLEEGLGRHARHHAVGERRTRRRARPAVDRRELAEDVAGLELGIDDLASLGADAVGAHRAAQDEEDIVGGILVAQDLGILLVGARRAALGDARELAVVQFFEQGDHAQVRGWPRLHQSVPRLQQLILALCELPLIEPSATPNVRPPETPETQETRGERECGFWGRAWRGL